jgi:hypothetical protein
MKIVKLLLILFVVATFAQSCDDWLNVTASDQVRAEDQFSSEEGFKDALIGVYLGMADQALYSKDLTWNMVDILSQQYANLSQQALYNEIQTFDYETSLSAPRVNAVWSEAYNVIANINSALHYIDENEEVLDPINYDIIKGELLALRVYLHLDLMRLYGHSNIGDRSVGDELTVPYVREYSKEIPERYSNNETFSMMEEDLNEALELLQTDPVYDDPDRPEDFYEDVNNDGFYDNRKQRMNYWAAKALEARLLAWQGSSENLDLARQAAEEVIDNSQASLIDSDSYPVSNDPILYQETLFSVYVNAFEDIINDLLDASDQTNFNAVYLTDGTVEEVYETNNSAVGPPDIRYNTLLESQTLGYVSVKLFQESGHNNPDRIPLIKLPEMYYIAAEYYVNNNGKDQAIDYLNTVRDSRGIVEEIPETATEEEVREEIFKEYRKEYVSEGQLFFYYKRTGVVDIPAVSQNVEADDEIYMLPYPDSELEFRNQ